MGRKSYTNADKMMLMCRVCLTRSTNVMYDLSDNVIMDGSNPVSILEALEKVTSVKVLTNGIFPQCICPMCISILKMSFKFISQFEESQKEIRNVFDKSPIDPQQNNGGLEIVKDEETDGKEKAAPVEIIFGKNKFSLNDVIVVEETKKEESNFKGFLQNLGNEVSASFTDKSKINKAINSENGGVSIYLTDNVNGIVPVKELKIDDELNIIDYVVEDDDLSSVKEELSNLDFIEIENLNDVEIESLIIERDETEESSKYEPRAKRVIKVGKKKKSIRELKTDDMIIMGPDEFEAEKINTEEDIFEREVKFPCDICKKIFPSTKYLRAHKRRTHTPKTRQFTCEICGYKNNTRSGHMHHKLKHKDKQFVCEICSKTYYTRAVLKVHMATHVNKRQHLCNVCGKGFNYANALVYHMRLHTGERNYKCEYCNEKFRMPNSLKRHIRTHTGERPYICKFCDRGFCSRGELQCHENIHTGYRPYHCKHCMKGYSKTHNLKLHLLSHEGPHKCDFCGKGFIEAAILSMHYRISHKDETEDKEMTDTEMTETEAMVTEVAEDD